MTNFSLLLILRTHFTHTNLNKVYIIMCY